MHCYTITLVISQENICYSLCLLVPLISNITFPSSIYSRSCLHAGLHTGQVTTAPLSNITINKGNIT